MSSLRKEGILLTKYSNPEKNRRTIHIVFSKGDTKIKKYIRIYGNFKNKRTAISLGPHISSLPAQISDVRHLYWEKWSYFL